MPKQTTAEVAAVLALETVVRDHAGGPAHVGVEAGRVTGEAHVLDTAEGDHVPARGHMDAGGIPVL